MGVPYSYHLDRVKKSNLTKQIYHFTNLERFFAYLKAEAIYSKATLWAKDLYPVRARTKSADGDNGFIDYIFFGNYNWLRKGRVSYYGYVGIEIQFGAILNREHFYYTFNSGADWINQANTNKYSDLTTLDKIFDDRRKYWSSEILVRRKVSFQDVSCILIPEGLQLNNDKGPARPEIAKRLKDLGLDVNLLIEEKKMNNTQENHASSKEYKIVLDNSNSMGIDLGDTQFSSDTFEIELLNKSDKLVFFFIPETRAISGLIAKQDNVLYVRDTDKRVGVLETCSHP